MWESTHRSSAAQHSTFNTLRTPTLLYNSEFAHPYPILPLRVTQLSTTTTPDSVEVKFWLTINGVDQHRATQRWGGNQWPRVFSRLGGSRLIYDGFNDTTGFGSYKYEVANLYPGNVRLLGGPAPGSCQSSTGRTAGSAQGEACRARAVDRSKNVRLSDRLG